LQCIKHIFAKETRKRVVINEIKKVPGEEYTRKTEETERRNEEALRSNWEIERVESMRRMYEKPLEPQQVSALRDQDYGANGSRPIIRDRSPRPMLSDRRIQAQHAPRQRQVVSYDYDDRYVANAREPLQGRARSPHIIDRRYAPTSIQREERLGRTDSSNVLEGNPRYDSVRHEKDHERSRSPVYVKLGPQPEPYREHSPGPRYAAQEPIYRSRTSQGHLEDFAYERVPRPEYYRVYAEEPRPRQPQYESQIEYVQVSDPKGDYVIRRPVRREAEPVFAYPDEAQTRGTVLETRAPVSRSDPAYYEEYDPRHPAPPPQTTIRQVRYQ